MAMALIVALIVKEDFVKVCEEGQSCIAGSWQRDTYLAWVNGGNPA